MTIYEFHTEFNSFRLATGTFIPYVIQRKFRLQSDYSYRTKGQYKTRKTADRFFQKLFTEETKRAWSGYEDYSANTPPPFKMSGERE